MALLLRKIARLNQTQRRRVCLPFHAAVRPKTMKPPCPYQIYEDSTGAQFVLLKLQLAVTGTWLCLAVKPLRLVLLSQFNLDRMQYIGRVSLKP